MSAKVIHSDEGSVLSSGISGMANLVSMQLSVRIITFFFNLLVARELNPGMYGIATVVIPLLSTSALFLAREGVRRATMCGSAHNSQKQQYNVKAQRSQREEDERQSIVNLSYIVILVGGLVLVTQCLLVIYRPQPGTFEAVDIDDYIWSIKLVGLSVVLELLSEPAYVVTQSHMLLFWLRARSESFAQVIKCTIIIIIVLGLDHKKLDAFAWGQVGYSMVLLLSYNAYFFRVSSWSVLFPKRLLSSQSPYFLPNLSNLSRTFTLQAAEKLLLQEGEKIVMLWFGIGGGIAEQGVYGLVTNLGSIVVRFLFLPLEETAFATFGKLSVASRTRTLSQNTASRFTNKTKSDQNEEAPLTPMMEQLLRVLLSIVLLVGLTFISFGPSYAHLLFQLLYGEKWSETAAPKVLGYYCAYILLIAVNGTTEAFVHSVAKVDDLTKFNYWLIICSVGYMAAAIGLVQFGSIGLIAANYANMVLRISFSSYYIYNRFYNYRQQQPQKRKTIVGVFSLWELLPSHWVIMSFILSAGITQLSKELIYLRCRTYGRLVGWLNIYTIGCCIAHVTIGLTCLVGISLVLVFKDRTLIHDARQLWQQRKQRSPAVNLDKDK